MRPGALLVPLALLALAGCAAPATDGPGTPAPGTVRPSGVPSRTGTPTGTLTAPVVVTRTGGIAGLRDTVVVDPDGRWRHTGRAGSGTGRLAADRLAALAGLAADPRLPAEAGHRQPLGRCADAVAYSVTAGGSTIRYSDCPADPGRPVVAPEIVRLVLSTTVR